MSPINHICTLPFIVTHRSHPRPSLSSPTVNHTSQYRTNRDIVLATLRELNIDEKASPADGAFYVYVDLSAHGVTDSMALSRRLLEEAGVAVTSGVDFEDSASGLGQRRVRFSYSRSTDEVREVRLCGQVVWVGPVWIPASSARTQAHELTALLVDASPYDPLHHTSFILLLLKLHSSPSPPIQGMKRFKQWWLDNAKTL